MQIDTGDRPPDARNQYVQSLCVSTYFGKDARLGLGGDGTIFLGAVIPTDGSKSYGVLGPGFSLGAAYELRLVSPTCDDSEKGKAVPAQVTTASAHAKGNHQLFINFGGAGSVVSLLDLRSNDSLAFSLALTAPIGLRYENVWWSHDDDITTKNTFSFGFGALVGYGTVQSVATQTTPATTTGGTTVPATTTGSSSSSGAVLAGGYVSVRLVF